MMIDCIIYASESGHTKKYALELSTRLSIPAYTLKEAKKKIEKGSTILYMSWILEHKLVGFDKLSRYQVSAAVGVGISPNSVEHIARIKEESFLYCPLFYLRGGINKKKLRWRKRWSLKMISSELSYKVLEQKASNTELEILDAILHNLDYSNMKDLDDIVRWYFKKNPEEGIVS